MFSYCARVLAGIIIVVSLLSPRESEAARRRWFWAGKSMYRKWDTNITLGIRAQTKYNRVAVLSTPPQSLLGELQVTRWYQKTVGLYAYFAKSVAQENALDYGAGIKFPFIALEGGRGKFVGGATMQLIADFGSYHFDPAVAPKSYQSSGFLVRYGGGMNWGFSTVPMFVDTTMMITRINGNFFIAPFLGVGVHF